jgi:predicted transcriptional regulator
MPRTNYRVPQSPTVARGIEQEIDILIAIANGAETAAEIEKALSNPQNKLRFRLKRLTKRGLLCRTRSYTTARAKGYFYRLAMPLKGAIEFVKSGFMVYSKPHNVDPEAS